MFSHWIERTWQNATVVHCQHHLYSSWREVQKMGLAKDSRKKWEVGGWAESKYRHGSWSVRSVQIINLCVRWVIEPASSWSFCSYSLFFLFSSKWCQWKHDEGHSKKKKVKSTDPWGKRSSSEERVRDEGEACSLESDGGSTGREWAIEINNGRAKCSSSADV